jgi:hypothetical protein
MPGKIEGSLSHAQLSAFLEELKAISARPTLAAIQASAKRYGVDVSIMGAKTFRDHTFQAHLDRLAAGREKSAQILQAVREGGAHPLDAVEEAASADLLDAYTSGNEVDVAGIVKVALQLRASIEQRKDRHRADADLARKTRETEAKLSLAEQQVKLRDEQISKLQAQAAERAEKINQAKAALTAAKKKGGLSKESLQKIEEAAGLL